LIQPNSEIAKVKSSLDDSNNPTATFRFICARFSAVVGCQTNGLRGINSVNNRLVSVIVSAADLSFSPIHRFF